VPRYLAWRLALFLPTLLVASLVIFLIMRALPGDVAVTVLSGSGEAVHDLDQIERVRQELGLDDPLPVQYARWLWSMASGELGGRSLEDRTPIRSLVARQLPVTVQLTLYTVVLAALVSIPLGVLAALHRGRWLDHFVRAISIGGQSIPGFFVALLLILGLTLTVRWSPPIVYRNLWEDPLAHLQVMLLPVLVLAWSYGAYLARITRAAVLDVLRQDYVRTARSKGLRERTVLFRHALRNALIPIVSVAGLQIGALLSGAVVLESIFGLPGLGRGIVQAVTVRDYPVIQTLAVLLVFLMLAVNLLTDLLYALIDPRISYAAS
jgi:peptide/nickel transport system permease protein